MKFQIGNRDITLLFVYPRHWMGMVGQCHAPAILTRERDPLFLVQETGWAPGSIWKGAKKLASAGILSPDCPAGSESLYRLHHPSHRSQNRNRNTNSLFIMCFLKWVSFYTSSEIVLGLPKSVGFGQPKRIKKEIHRTAFRSA
jgi:hypothetical protein